MHKYAAADSIIDGVSNIYLISIATAFLAVILALYFSNFLKDENKIPLKKLLNNDGDENVGVENYLNDTSNELENRYRIKMDSEKHSESTNLMHQSDCKDNNTDTKMHSSNDGSDIDSDTDEIHIDGLVGKLKSRRVKDLEAQLTRDQLEEEKRIEREQLAAIFELLKKQEAELNMKEIDETELNAQLALYR